MSETSISDMRDLIRMKKEDPEGYKKFLEDYLDVAKDMHSMAMELARRMVKE